MKIELIALALITLCFVKSYSFHPRRISSLVSFNHPKVGSTWQPPHSLDASPLRVLQSERTELDPDYTISLPRRAAYLSGALGLLLYAFTLAPGGGPDALTADSALIAKLMSSAALDGTVNAIFVFIFNAFVVVPSVYAALLLPGAKKQRFPTLLFTLASFGFGFFALGPYLAFRDIRTEVSKKEVGLGSNLFGSRFVAIILLSYALYNVYYLFTQGSITGWSEQIEGFWNLFSSQRLVHVSTLDMTLLSLAVSRVVLLWS